MSWKIVQGNFDKIKAFIIDCPTPLPAPVMKYLNFSFNQSLNIPTYKYLNF